MAYYKNEISLFSTEDYDDTAIKNKINALNEELEFLDSVYTPIEGTHISTDSNVGYAKDVEILGNTVQDASNLVDIRSVGDKVEGQELYKIDVVSCGKNLFNGATKLGTFDNSTGIISNSTTLKISDYIPAKPNTFYMFSQKDYIDSNDNIVICEYDKDFKPVKNKAYGFYYNTVGQALKLETNSSTKYLLFRYIFGVRNIPIENIQIEEGTQSTPYEPYIEDKLTILSPVQLEKVGDVADRIICKDGVWGVEKNIETYYPDLNKIYNYRSMENSFRVSSNSTDAIVTPKTSRSICNLLIEGVESDWTSDKQCCYVLTNNILVIKGDIRNASNLEEAREWIKSSGLYIKYPTTQPQFIPLLHDQQIKLRTFANKTNIHFETEIEGTIKAQVPKSIGATVNTHTEQINNLNKELDRVKKLEESTVSIVETESDFTTVEETSNGYFEDVKLEGKTLVNLAPKYSIEWTHSGTWLSTFLVGTKNPADNHYKIIQDLKPNTEYTVIVNIKTNTQSGKIDLNNYQSTVCAFKDNMFVTPSDIGIKIFKVKTVESFDNINPSDMAILRSQSWGIASGETLIEDIMILEGDHTNNPPSYFEGLKSIGDGVDEVSVISNTNMLIPGLEYKNLDISHSYRCSSPIQSLTTATIANISNNIIQLGLFNRTTEEHYINIDIQPNTTIELNSQLIDNYIKWVSFTKSYWENKSDTTQYYKHLVINGNVDKKPLLYYNPTTETWEKPILRQWDSIEKHSDGKYYYHKRSGEVVLNGSENWYQAVKGDDFARYYINTITDAKSEGDIICNVLTNKIYMNNVNNNTIINTICVTGNKYLYIGSSITLTSEFKTWLQTNNVTAVYQLAQEEVYECTNIDLITYANETNYIVNSGAIVPKTTLKVHNDIANVILLLLKKISLLEAKITVMFKFVLSGDYQSLAYELYPEDFGNIIETGAYTIRDSEE